MKAVASRQWVVACQEEVVDNKLEDLVVPEEDQDQLLKKLIKLERLNTLTNKLLMF